MTGCKNTVICFVGGTYARRGAFLLVNRACLGTMLRVRGGDYVRVIGSPFTDAAREVRIINVSEEGFVV